MYRPLECGNIWMFFIFEQKKVSGMESAYIEKCTVNCKNVTNSAWDQFNVLSALFVLYIMNRIAGDCVCVAQMS